MAEQKFVPGMYEFTLLGVEISKQYGGIKVVSSPQEMKPFEDENIIFDVARVEPGKISFKIFPKSEISTLIKVSAPCRSKQDLDNQIRTAKLDNFILGYRAV